MSLPRTEILRRVRYSRQSDAASAGGVPSAPGTTPIPAGHVRLYHYDMSPSPGEAHADSEIAAGYQNEGIPFRASEGESVPASGHTQGTLFSEPDRGWAPRAYKKTAARPSSAPSERPTARLWAFTRPPESHRVFAEFSMHPDDPRWAVGKPKDQRYVDNLNKHDMSVTFRDSIAPNEIVAVHEPWHNAYRHLIARNLVPAVLAGKLDHVLGRNTPEAKAVAYIKSHPR